MKKIRKQWQTSKEGSDKILRHNKFGKFWRHKTTGLWWIRDTAGHGGSEFKVYREAKEGLKWIADADEYGDYILSKHKGDIGKFISWKELSGR